MIRLTGMGMGDLGHCSCEGQKGQEYYTETHGDDTKWSMLCLGALASFIPNFYHYHHDLMTLSYFICNLSVIIAYGHFKFWSSVTRQCRMIINKLTKKYKDQVFNCA